MRAGNLDRLITIQRKTDSVSASGNPVATWSAMKHLLAASARPLRGEERFTTAQNVASEQMEFIVRYSDAVADLSPLDRVLFPPPDTEDEQSPASRSVFDILAVAELGRHEGLRITAQRRADV